MEPRAKAGRCSGASGMHFVQPLLFAFRSHVPPQFAADNHANGPVR